MKEHLPRYIIDWKSIFRYIIYQWKESLSMVHYRLKEYIICIHYLLKEGIFVCGTLQTERVYSGYIIYWRNISKYIIERNKPGYIIAWRSILSTLQTKEHIVDILLVLKEYMPGYIMDWRNLCPLYIIDWRTYLNGIIMGYIIYVTLSNSTSIKEYTPLDTFYTEEVYAWYITTTGVYYSCDTL